MRPAVVILAALTLCAGGATAWCAPPSIAVAGRPVGGAAVGDRLWVLVDRAGERRAVEVDPAAGRVTGRSVRIGRAGPRNGPRQWQVVAPATAVVVRGSFWTLDASTHTALRIDTARARVAARVRAHVDAIAAGEGGLWALGPIRPLIVDHRPVGWIHRILSIDPRTGRTLPRERSIGPGVGTTSFDRFAVGRDRVWLSARSATGRIGREVEWEGVSARPIDGWRFTAHAGALFTASFPCTVIVRPGTRGAVSRSLRMLPPRRCDEVAAGGSQPQDVAAGPSESVWQIVLRGEQPGIRRRPGLVSWRRIDGTGPLHTAVVGRDPVALMPLGDGVWVADGAAGRLTRVAG